MAAGMALPKMKLGLGAIPRYADGVADTTLPNPYGAAGQAVADPLGALGAVYSSIVPTGTRPVNFGRGAPAPAPAVPAAPVVPAAVGAVASYNSPATPAPGAPAPPASAFKPTAAEIPVDLSRTSATPYQIATWGAGAPGAGKMAPALPPAVPAVTPPAGGVDVIRAGHTSYGEGGAQRPLTNRDVGMLTALAPYQTPQAAMQRQQMAILGSSRDNALRQAELAYGPGSANPDPAKHNAATAAAISDYYENLIETLNPEIRYMKWLQSQQSGNMAPPAFNFTPPPQTGMIAP